MQYKKYEIQVTEDGCIIRDSIGNFISSTATDTEAKEYIDDLDDEPLQINTNLNEVKKTPNSHEYMDVFRKYCAKLPGKCEIDGYLATTNEPALCRFIKSFEKLWNVTVHYKSVIRGGEYFYLVDDIY